MAQREKRIIKWAGTIPVEAICAACHREFVALPPFTGTKAEAEAVLDIAFLEHKCTPDEPAHVV